MRIDKPQDLLPGIICEVDYLSPEVQEAQRKAEFRNAAIRHAERMAAYAAWVKPEAIAERKEKHEREAAESLAQTRAALGITGESEPLPDEKDLPKEMRGQAPSTIRAWLKHERDKPNLGFVVMEEERIIAAVPPKCLRRERWYHRFMDWFR